VGIHFFHSFIFVWALLFPAKFTQFQLMAFNYLSGILHIAFPSFERRLRQRPTNFHSAKSAKSNLNIYAQILFKAKRVKPNKIK